MKFHVETNFNDHEISRMIPHLFLPRKLPGLTDEHLEQDEANLLLLMRDCICETHNFSNKQYLHQALNVFDTWTNLQCQQVLDVDRIQEEIQSLQSGDTFALYIRAQNCGFVLSFPHDKSHDRTTAILSTFPASQRSDNVMSQVGDISVVYPSSSVHIPKSYFLLSKTFARQLSELCARQYNIAMPETRRCQSVHSEIRDVADPLLITKFITAMLTDQESDSCIHYPKVSKTIRDQVSWNDSRLPFRRSGLWTTAKVVLHLCLVNTFGKSDGTFVHKLVILRLLMYCCERASHISVDVRVQMLTKVTRRLCKLERYDGNVSQQFADLYSELRVLVIETMKLVRDELNNAWKQIVDTHSTKMALPKLDDLDFTADTKLPYCTYKIYQFGEQSQSLHGNQPVPTFPSRHRVYDTADFHLSHFDITGEENASIALWEFEQYVFKLFDEHAAVWNCQYIRKLFEQYVHESKIFYKNDPVGGSRMILTCLKILQVLDSITVEAHPMLQQHHSGVDISIVKDLLLPQYEELWTADELELYFTNRNKSKYPSLIENKVSKESFSARFASSDHNMSKKRNEILVYSETEIRLKLDEVKRVRHSCRKLRLHADGIEHKYKTKLIAFGIEKKKHVPKSCNKCSLINTADNMQVLLYERPLPEVWHEQNAVIFELMIPKEIACLRDALYFFRKEICSMVPVGSVPSKVSWTNYSELKKHHNGYQEYVKLGSTVKAFTSSHYKSKHPEQCDDDDFIVANGLNCYYTVNNLCLKNSDAANVKQHCTYHTDQDDVYRCLSWTVRDTQHTQNDILAQQATCHKDLSLSEFKDFGSLRAGHRLQLRNIYRCLLQGTLAFHKESVFNLILQAVWQAGTRSSKPCIGRESNEDLLDYNFTSEFLYLLEKVLKEQSENWTNYYVLLTVIVITARILTFALSEVIASRAIRLILECRHVANNWAVKIDDLLTKMTAGSRKKVEELKRLTIFVSICSALTFWVSAINIPSIIQDTESVKCWLISIARIKDSVTLSKSGVHMLPTSLRNLLRWVRFTGLAIEGHLHEFLQRDTAGINAFAEDHLPGYRIAVKGIWTSCGGANKQVYHCKCVDNKQNEVLLHMDIVCGNFLVNGNPVGYLPEAITNNPSYQQVFSNTIFEVQPVTSQLCEQITRLKYHKCNYSFSLQNELLIVTEIHDNGELFQLIPHELFKGIIPQLLISDFSHWWNKTKNVVLFRPKSFSEERFVEEIKYVLDLNTDSLINTTSRKSVIDIKSKSFFQISKVINLLESPDYLIVFHGQNIINVALPRMGLHFDIHLNQSNELLPREYPEMKVCKTQKFGTLVGLSRGLLLESINSSINTNRILLMPHGNVTLAIHPEETHQQVDVELDKLRRPEFFAFEVDYHLCQLRAGQSHVGWLYLAYLHALTASPLPDPFTQLTGTESALRLLNSAHCWSCQPLEEEATQTLGAIAKLSPRRNYYPPNLKCMENVAWPQGLSSVSADDCFKIAVSKLIQDSQRLSFLGYRQDQETKSSRKDETGNILIHKTLWHHRAVCPELGMGFTECLASLQQVPETAIESAFCNNLNEKKMQSIRTISSLCHNWLSNHCLVVNKNLLKTFLVDDNDTLTGVRGVTFDSMNLMDIMKLDFKSSWLDLYNFARTVRSHQLENKWTLLLCVFAFCSFPLEQLLLLHTVAVYAKWFEQINPPNYYDYCHVCEYDFNPSTVKTIFKQCAFTFEEYLEQTNQNSWYEETMVDFEARKRRIKHKYDSSVADQVYELAKLVKQEWPTDKCDSFLYVEQKFQQIHIEQAVQPLNEVLTRWFKNLELLLFVQNVENVFVRLPKSTEVTLSHIILPNSASVKKRCYQNKRFFETDLNNTMRGSVLPRSDPEYIHYNDYKDIDKIFRTGYISCVEHKDFIEVDGSISAEQFPWDLHTNCQIGASYLKDNKESWDAYCKKSKKTVLMRSHPQKFVEHMQHMRSFYTTNATRLWKCAVECVQSFNHDYQMQAIKAAGLFPKLAPVTLLPLICSKELKEPFCSLIGATAVLWTLEQQANRCIKFAKLGDSHEVALKKELENRAHMNWSPKDKPEWLLLELEMNIMIRHGQVEVANAMLQPEDNQHIVMQLNMGEGKTAVIIPMIVSLLANGKQLCRVTVLKSLFHMNKGALAYKIGGLLNRRTYTFPCRRDMSIGEYEARTMLEVYKECVSKRGVALLLPEHRLSFQLKGYEKSRQKVYSDARALLEVQKWLNKNSRDILDESDEILHVKYQLVYTIGAQVLPGGGRLRWTVAQSLLELVPSRLSDIEKRYGPNVADCNFNGIQNEGFPYCRLLKSNYYQDLCKLLVMDILDGKLSVAFPDLRAKSRNVVSKFLRKATISIEDYDEVMRILESEVNASQCDVLLILRGLLACGVLSLVLSKRWKVNYGVDPKGHRLMAVPFRAKDVAADRTEFGHPDMAILCTTLSYYYSGLSATQLDQCFDQLYRQRNRDQEYKLWVSKLPNAHPSIQTLSGINLKDFHQKEMLLYPALLKNPEVINFYLDTIVFPKECKQFESKMSCSPWDLCSQDFSHPVTGFSGTNDTKLLLPFSITQKDLPSLLGTNGKVLYNLLRRENSEYYSLPAGASSRYILKRLVQENIPLLLDVGALMTDSDNKTVAVEWLKLTRSYKKEAAIYFDEDDKLVVIDRNNRFSLLELSHFRWQLEKCVIYLDDFHTRGTDLKIPHETKGCVTLGKGVTKDKLVQGCMRMRMLGEGHNVCFWASKEVNNEIKRICRSKESKIQTKDVLSWAMENSCVANRDGFIHWAVGGFNFSKKKTAHFLFENSSQTNVDVSRLGKRCSDKEVINLKKMYATYRTEDLFPVIAQDCFEHIKTQFSPSSLEQRDFINSSAASMMLDIDGGKIVKQCKRFVPDVKRLSYLLDEEQERELEHELEEECDVERPQMAQSAQHYLDDNVIRFVVDGVLPDTSANTWCATLPETLKNTKLWPTHVQVDCWGHNIYATNDFVEVVADWNDMDGADQFLRPVNWITAVRKNGVATLLLLSPFEANELIPVFRSGKACAILHMFAARLSCDQNMLFGSPELALPSSTAAFSYQNCDNLFANLALFSGNLYFSNKIDEDIYTSFLGLILRPRTEREQFIFDEGCTVNGFVKPSLRSRLPYITSHFQRPPDALVRGIIERRFEDFPEQCHVYGLIVECKKTFT